MCGPAVQNAAGAARSTSAGMFTPVCMHVSATAALIVAGGRATPWPVQPSRKIEVIGPPLFVPDEKGQAPRIATAFPRHDVLVTEGWMHVWQRDLFIKVWNERHRQQGLPPLTESEQMLEWEQSVNLIIDDTPQILIRPDPDNMGLAFEADEMLQALAPRQRIRFLFVLDPKVRDAIKRRGEFWRITPLPRTTDQMKDMIAKLRIALGGGAIYYYNNSTGTRLVTCQEFRNLAALDDEGLRRHLLEIQQFSLTTNRQRNPDIAFFMSGEGFTAEHLKPHDIAAMPADRLRAVHEVLCRRFRDATGPEFHRDDADNAQWRCKMFAALSEPKDVLVPEETMLGLGSEFYMQVEWLPGGRIERQESILECPINEVALNEQERLRRTQARAIVFSLMCEYGNLEYVNIGCVVNPLSLRPQNGGRRGVYIVEMKQRSADRDIVLMIRMQKFGIAEHLEEGDDLLTAIQRTDEYTQYILNRRFGCRQLGMNLPPRLHVGRITERYNGTRKEYRGQPFAAVYFWRDYVRGLATDKLHRSRFEDEEFAARFARLMGQAAAPNMIVGRAVLANNGSSFRIIFDDGDEVVFEDEHRLPQSITVSDHTGTFADYEQPLMEAAPVYAGPINRRLPYVKDRKAFADAYVGSFIERFRQIQDEYENRSEAFDRLFSDETPNGEGNFADRWQKVLRRLRQSDAQAIGDGIRENISL